MIEHFSFGNLLILIPLSVLVLFVLTFIIIPYLKVTSYKKKDVATYFYPILGYFHYLKQAVIEKDDIMAFAKGGNKETKYAKVLVTNLSNNLYIVFRDSEYVRDFFQKQKYYQKGRIFGVLKHLLGNGLLAAEGDTWKRHRKVISNSFHFEFLKDNMNVIQGTAKEFLNKITPSDYNNFPAISKVQEITGEIVGRIFFGENLNTYNYEGKLLTLALADIVADLGLAAKTSLVALLGAKALKIPFIPKYKKVMKSIHDFRQICFNIIKDRKTNQVQGKDLLSSLLATQKLEDSESRFSDEDIVDEFVTFFVTGMDTTGHLVGMALYNLTQYPEYLQKIKEERDTTYNQEKQVTTETLHNMDILHSLLKETLRFYSPSPLASGRVATADHKIGEFKVKKGDFVLPELLAAPFDEKLIENPEQFNPSRWMDPDSKINPFAFIPFSAGPRNCIGQHLALIEAKVILSEFLEMFDFKLIDGYKLRMVMRFLYEPDRDVLLNLSAQAK